MLLSVTGRRRRRLLPLMLLLNQLSQVELISNDIFKHFLSLLSTKRKVGGGQCDQSGRFFWQKNYLTKVSQHFTNVWTMFKQISFYVETCFGSFLATFGNKMASFHSSIWSHDVSFEAKHFAKQKHSWEGNSPGIPSG